MSRVYIGYDKYGLEGVDDEFIQFVFDVMIGVTKINGDSEVGLVITDDEQMRSLNKQYRGKDKTTNVLSFGYLETSQETSIPAEDKNYLGDIFMSYPLLLSESKELEMKPRDRFAHLFVHGLLHLAGHHHDTANQTQKMEDLEDQILTAVNSVE